MGNWDMNGMICSAAGVSLFSALIDMPDGYDPSLRGYPKRFHMLCVKAI